MTRRVVIVGASLAGATAATTLRDLGFDGTIDVIGAEPELPYERPALSKTFLTDDTASDTLLVNTGSEYDAFDIQMHLSTAATSLDVDARVVALSDGAHVEYDDVIIATGSINRRPDLAGIDLPGAHQLRTLIEAQALRAHARRASSAVIVGQGFIGCEVAAALRVRGLDVTMVDPQPGPLHGPLGAEVSERVAAWHRDHNVRMLNGVGIEEITGSDSVEGVRLSDGTQIAADLVVVGVGARPASDWLAGSGVNMERGAVLADRDGRTSIDGVHAAGDVAACWDDELGAHRRVEHYDSALVQGQRVAHTLLGSSAAARGRSWFWTDQYDHTLQYTGAQQPNDELLWRGGSTGFWLRGGLVTAVVAVDDGRTFRRAMNLVGTVQDPAELADEKLDLRGLARAAQPVPTPA